MKHKLNSTKKDLLGQYFTSEADKVLSNYTHLVEGKRVIDPCAGAGDLLSWASRNGAAEVIGYDIDDSLEWEVNDMYDNPVDCSGMFVVTNPPYLSKNRSKDKVPFEKWGQSDLYKCYLATLEKSNVDEALIIIPSNFLCESSSKARRMLFENYRIVSAEYWKEEVFEGVAIGIMVMHIKRTDVFSGYQKFTYENRTNGKVTLMELFADDYIHGPVELASNKFINFQKVDKGMDAPNSMIVVSLLDKGKRGLGLSMNYDEPIYCNPKSFTTYQINTPEPISESEQHEIVREFNKILYAWREEYDSMFLSNYIDYNQKIMSRSIVNKLLTHLWVLRLQ